jgi:hypothetical protein
MRGAALVFSDARRFGRLCLVAPGERERMPALAALDLSPRRVSFRLSGLPPGAKGWEVVVDPRDKGSEVFERNNSVVVRSGE